MEAIIIRQRIKECNEGILGELKACLNKFKPFGDEDQTPAVPARVISEKIGIKEFDTSFEYLDNNIIYVMGLACAVDNIDERGLATQTCIRMSIYYKSFQKLSAAIKEQSTRILGENDSNNCIPNECYQELNNTFLSFINIAGRIVALTNEATAKAHKFPTKTNGDYSVDAVANFINEL